MNTGNLSASLTADNLSASFGGLGDLWLVLALILPGFVMFKIISWIAVYEVKFDNFTFVTYSLICSLIIYVPISNILKIDSLIEIRSHIYQPEVIALLLAFAILFGVIAGVGLKFSLRRSFRFGSPWDSFGKEYLGKSVIVYTTENKEYLGWIKKISRGDNEERELCLGNPKLVKRDGKSKTIVPVGDDLLLTGKSILRILRISPG